MKIDPPADLSPASQAAWPGLCSDLVIATNGAEVDYGLLGDALRIRDRLAAIAAKLVEDGPTVRGSTGQVRAHPLLAVEANLRREYAVALDRLRLSPATRAHYFVVDRRGRLKEE